MSKNYFTTRKKNNGAVALVLVIMITTLTLVSAVVVALINISDLTANYHVSETETVQSYVDACVDDALSRIVANSAVSGNYSINVGNVVCTEAIGATAGGLKIVTSTATTTSDIGTWVRGAVLEVDVYCSPIMVNAYKDLIIH